MEEKKEAYREMYYKEYNDKTWEYKDIHEGGNCTASGHIPSIMLTGLFKDWMERVSDNNIIQLFPFILRELKNIKKREKWYKPKTDTHIQSIYLIYNEKDVTDFIEEKYNPSYRYYIYQYNSINFKQIIEAIIEREKK